MSTGIEHDVSGRVAPDRWVTLSLDPGIEVGLPGMWSDQTLRWILLAPLAHARTPHDYGTPFGELDDVTASELLATLTALTEGQPGPGMRKAGSALPAITNV
ncbi:hypothetical protein [Actinomadura parmotrematis]|uniref:Uncharacterized protein n=1 Tax=Actinomadura parmotrematis TaxID=2864039 RepID=A0ABS7FV50_9ACTN|nr:hypothetical protein [Actinomadura parmotrematis]MBW8484294.1 hypothetical protein [Actinomadura parmotrematis]